MNQRDDEQLSTARGFFHTMVVMGSALALGCGGESRLTVDVPERTADMNSGGTGNGTGGGTPSVAGSPSGGTGGIVVSSAGAGASVGGTSVGGSASITVPTYPDCVPSQWECTKNYICNAYVLDVADYCTCNSARPKTSADCATGDSYICFDGTKFDASGNEVDSALPYQCSCIPQQADCDVACAMANPETYLRCLNPAASPTDPILCGCAPVSLR
jgi:hypothetical protein